MVNFFPPATVGCRQKLRTLNLSGFRRVPCKKPRIFHRFHNNYNQGIFNKNN